MKGKTKHLKGWIIEDDSPCPETNLYFETLFTLGNGFLGLRGALEEAPPDAQHAPLCQVAGVYDKPAARLNPVRYAPVPDFLITRFHDGTSWLDCRTGTVLEHSRRLDMKRGILARYLRWQGSDGKITRLETRRFVSQKRHTIVSLLYTVTPENYSDEVKITTGIDGSTTYPDKERQLEVLQRSHHNGNASLAVKTLQSGIELAVYARSTFTSSRAAACKTTGRRQKEKVNIIHTFKADKGTAYTFEKTVAVCSSVHVSDPHTEAARAVMECPEYAVLENEHVAEWKRYWQEADIVVTGDRIVQTMARFSIFQLLQAASNNNVEYDLDASISARGLSGTQYSGHIFWDTEIYMLPFFNLLYPRIVRSLLQYRVKRIEAARKNARKVKCAGIKFPWESAATGFEETPVLIMASYGKIIRWHGGKREVHVNAAVPYALYRYYLATGDEETWHTAGVEIMIETCRYWMSRMKKVGSHYEIHKVMGPDEFNEEVNNSFYTNALARWNIAQTVTLLKDIRGKSRTRYMALYKKFKLSRKELSLWKRVIERIMIPFNPDTGVYPEFEGFFDRQNNKPKQADVLLALHLLPELASPEIVRKNFDIYEPITLHRSSLSPGIHVLSALEAGYEDRAYEYLLKTCAIDGAIPDTADNRGLHMATLGCIWMALVNGFGGVQVTEDGLQIDPKIPSRWKKFEFSIVYRGTRIHFSYSNSRLELCSDPDGTSLDLFVNGIRHTLKPGKPLKLAM
jgi:trehalose/maltose hydrolase-like predicted phosphorylase